MALLERNTNSTMDSEAIKTSLDQTISFKADERTQAETTLKGLETVPGFSQALMEIALSQGEQNLQRQLSAVILFKNMVRKNWSQVNKSVENCECAQVLESEREVLRTTTLEHLLTCTANRQVQKYLAEIFREMCASDYPASWTELPQVLGAALRRTDLLEGTEKENASNAPEVPVENFLLAICMVSKQYRLTNSITDTQHEVPADLELLLDEISLLWAETFPKLVDQALGHRESEGLRLATMALYRFTRSYLPTALEGMLFSSLLPQLVAVLRQLLSPPPSNAPEGEESTEKPNPVAPAWKLAKRILKLISSVQARQRPRLEPLMPELIEVLWGALQPEFQSRIPDRVLSMSLDLLGRALEMPQQKADVLSRVQQGFVPALFPLLCFGDEDREIWCDDPDEYLARNLDLEMEGVFDATFREDRYSARKSALSIMSQLVSEEASREKELKAAAEGGKKKGKRGRNKRKTGKSSDQTIGITELMYNALMYEFQSTKKEMEETLASSKGDLATLQSASKRWESRLCGVFLGLGVMVEYFWTKHASVALSFVRDEVMARCMPDGYDVYMGQESKPNRSPFVTAHMLWLVYQCIEHMNPTLNQMVMDTGLECMNIKDEEESEEDEATSSSGNNGDLSLSGLDIAFEERSWKPVRVTATFIIYKIIQERYDKAALSLVLNTLVAKMLSAAEAEQNQEGMECNGLPMRIFHLVVEVGEEDLLPHMKQISGLLVQQCLTQIDNSEDMTASIGLEALGMLATTVDTMWEGDEEEEEDESDDEEENDEEETKEEEDGNLTAFKFGADFDDTLKGVTAQLCVGMTAVVEKLWMASEQTTDDTTPVYIPEACMLFGFVLKRGTAKGSKEFSLACRFYDLFLSWTGTCEMENADEAEEPLQLVAKQSWKNAEDVAVVCQKLRSMLQKALEDYDKNALRHLSLALRLSFVSHEEAWKHSKADVLAIASMLSSSLCEAEEGSIFQAMVTILYCHVLSLYPKDGLQQLVDIDSSMGMLIKFSEALTAVSEEPKSEILSESSRKAVTAIALRVMVRLGSQANAGQARKLGDLFEGVFEHVKWIQAANEEDENEEEEEDQEEEGDSDEEESEEEEEETEEEFLARYAEAAQEMEQGEEDEKDWDETEESLEEAWEKRNVCQDFVTWCENHQDLVLQLVKRAKLSVYQQEFSDLKKSILEEES